MNTLELFLIGIAILYVVAELSSFLTFGGFVSKEVTEMFMKLDESQIRMNPYSNTILSTNPYIAFEPGFSIFAKYYINGLGRVPRWSKLHKRIEHYFAVAVKNQNNLN